MEQKAKDIDNIREETYKEKIESCKEKEEKYLTKESNRGKYYIL
jgi:hypothetical protein